MTDCKVIYLKAIDEALNFWPDAAKADVEARMNRWAFNIWSIESRRAKAAEAEAAEGADLEQAKVSANQAKYEAFIKRSNEWGTNVERIIFSECVKTDAGYLFNFYAEWTKYLVIKKSGSFTLQIDKNGEALAVEKNIQQR